MLFFENDFLQTKRASQTVLIINLNNIAMCLLISSLLDLGTKTNNLMTILFSKNLFICQKKPANSMQIHIRC